MKESRESSALPNFVTKLFRDVDPAGIDVVGHRDFILGRILSSGTLDAIRWARRRYGDDAIRDWIVRHEGRQNGGCMLESLIDLATLKLLAVAQRGTRKDFVDVHALGRHVPLARMLDCYRRRFAVADASRVLAGLCYFDDAEAEPMPTMLLPLDWETVKRELRDMVRAAT